VRGSPLPLHGSARLLMREGERRSITSILQCEIKKCGPVDIFLSIWAEITHSNWIKGQTVIKWVVRKAFFLKEGLV